MTAPARWAVAFAIVSAMARVAHATEASPLPPAELPPAGTIAPAFQPRTLDPDPTKTHSDPAWGHVFGGALGYGTFNYYGCGSVCGDAWTGELHGGGFLTNGMALEGELWGGLHGFSTSQLGAGHSALVIWTLALQCWFGDIFWVKVGMGVGRIQTIGGHAGSALAGDSAFALVLATGVELYRTYHAAVDLQVRYGSVSFSGRDDNPNPVAALVGLTWR